MEIQKLIKSYLNEEMNTVKRLDVEDIERVYYILNYCLHHNRHVYIFGNGGSGSTASHMANDFNKARFEKTDNTFNFTCLNDNIPILLAIANDISYDEVFRYQLVNSLTPDDVVIAISGSGNSKNIINAVDYAKGMKSTVIGFTGFDGGMLKKLADCSIDTNIHNMQMTEDIHLLFDHLLISMFYQTYGEKKYHVRKLSKNTKQNNNSYQE